MRNIQDLNSEVDSILRRLDRLEGKPVVTLPPSLSLDPPSRPVYPSYTPGPPVGVEVMVSTASDTDIGSVLNQAMAKLRGTSATFIVDSKLYRIVEQIRLSPFHHLRLSDGARLQCVGFHQGPKGAEEGAIIQGSDTTIVGLGTATIVEPREKLFIPAVPDSKFRGHVIIQSEGNTRGPDNRPDLNFTEVSERIELHDITIEGSPMQPEGGSMSTIQYGNAHGVTITHVRLKGTSSLGITAGGIALSGNHAEDWGIHYCELNGVASQGLAVINGVRIVFQDCIIENSGKLLPNGTLYEGMTCVDLEPNAFEDQIDVQVRRIYIDSRMCKQSHGNGIQANNAANVLGYKAVIEHCVVFGGLLDKITPTRVSNGIIVGPNAYNVNVNHNYISRCGQSGMYSDKSHDNIYDDNVVISSGTGGNKAWRFDDVINSKVRRNRVLIDPTSPAATGGMYAFGDSSGNVYEDNESHPTKDELSEPDSRFLVKDK